MLGDGGTFSHSSDGGCYNMARISRRYVRNGLYYLSPLLSMLLFFLVGVDYLPQSLSFQFPPTDVTILNNSFSLSVSERLRQPLPLSPPVCANVSIINDDILEANKFKSFFLNLSHPGPVVQLRTPHVATVIIADDDGKLRATIYVLYFTSHYHYFRCNYHH